MQPDPAAPDIGSAHPPPNTPLDSSSGLDLDKSNLVRPRLWTVFAVVVASAVVYLLASVLLTFLTVLLFRGRLDLQTLSPESIQGVMSDRRAIVLTVLLPQLAMIMPVLAAAWLSPRKWTRRLSLVRGHWPVWIWLAAALATPLVGMISGALCGMFLDESESLKMMGKIFRQHGSSGFLVPIVMLIGLTPAVCEELLFRGYVQSRLTRAMHPVLGIFIASLLFAAFHLDFVHVIVVFPIGMYLGWVSWRSGSLLPAMLGHLVNNVLSVLILVIAPEEQANAFAVGPAIVFLSILSLGVAGLFVTMAASVRFGPPPTDDDFGTDIVPEDDGDHAPGPAAALVS